MMIKSVGVIGAGVMGVGVAQNLAQSGFNVILIDISNEILLQAKEKITQNIRLSGLFGKTKLTEDLSAIMDRISFYCDFQQIGDVNYVIENVTEKIEIKEDVYRQLDENCQQECIYAVNTSCIPITQVASMTNRPDKVIGIHFMNPVPMKSSVEVIRAYHTSEKTIEITKTLLADMGKDCIIVNDSPGFVSNRVLMLTINEAIFLVLEQVSTPEDIDDIFKSCFGHKMGPLETADLIGLDTILYSLDVLYEQFNDSKYRPCPLLKKMVAAGLHGQKSGKGFYNY